LKPSETKKVVNQLVSELWEKQVSQPTPTPLFVVFEESEIFLKNIRGSVNEEVYRLVHVGRNFRIRCVLITTDLALLDTSAIRLCSVRFHGSLNIEENSKRKFKSYYGKDWCRVAHEGLSTGDFVILSKKKLTIKSVPLFKPTSQPQLHIETKERITASQPQQYTKHGWTRYV